MKESREAVVLAGIGAAQGIWRYYIRPELNYARGWLLVGSVVAAYELSCPAGQTLSEGVDRALEEHPVMTTLGVGAVALHLLNLLPNKLDPIHQLNNLRKY